MPNLADLDVKLAVKRDAVEAKDCYIAFVSMKAVEPNGTIGDQAIENLNVRLFVGDTNDAQNSLIYCKTMTDEGGGMYRYDADGAELLADGAEWPAVVNIRAYTETRNVIFPVARDKLS